MTPDRIVLAALTIASACGTATAETLITSPDQRLAVTVSLSDKGVPAYQIQLDGKPVLRESKLGLIRDDADFSQGLKLVSESAPQLVKDTYELPGSKRLHNTYQAQRRVLQFERDGGAKLDIVFQVSNDGVAFRYRFPETNATTP